MKTSGGVFLGLLLLTFGCGSPPPPASPAPAPAPASPPPAPEPKEEPPPPEDPEPPPEATPAAPEKPKSTAMIGETSISDIDGQALVAEVQKLKWAPEKVEVMGGSVGKYENLRFGIHNGTLGGHIELIRPAKEPSGGASMMSPKDQKAMHENQGAVFLDETADVLVIVIVDGKPAEAKKLLDKLIKK
ncbi:MAG: hypothetical protein R3B13_02635 [Polyangiaceae bacterium]